MESKSICAKPVVRNFYSVESAVLTFANLYQTTFFPTVVIIMPRTRSTRTTFSNQSLAQSREISHVPLHTSK